MKFRLNISDDVVDVFVEQKETEQALRCIFEDRAYDVRYEALSEGRYHLIVNGQVHEAFVLDDRDGRSVFMKGRLLQIQDADRVTSRRAGCFGTEDSLKDVTPPMPAVVVRILVREGDRVQKGQGLLVVTAMKMESTLVAPYDGRITKINTAVDAKVMPGEILVEIEKGGSKDEG